MIDHVRGIFDKANFVRHLGIELVNVRAGGCDTQLMVREEHLQQHGSVHAGVIATLADHSAGGAARTVTGDLDVVTIEYKINYLRPAMGERLRCVASVVSKGKNIVVTEAEVFAIHNGQEKLVAKLTETLAVIGERVVQR